MLQEIAPYPYITVASCYTWIDHANWIMSKNISEHERTTYVHIYIHKGSHVTFLYHSAAFTEFSQSENAAKNRILNMLWRYSHDDNNFKDD